MKQRFHRTLSLLLSVLLLVQLLPLGAAAAGTETASENSTLTAATVPAATEAEAPAETGTLQPGYADWSRAETLTLSVEETNRFLSLGGDPTKATPDDVRALLGEDVGGSALGDGGLSQVVDTPALEGITPLTTEPGQMELSYYLTDDAGNTAVLDEDTLLTAVEQAASEQVAPAQTAPVGTAPDAAFLSLSDQALNAHWTPEQSIIVVNTHQIGFAAYYNEEPVKDVHFRAAFYQANENGIKAEDTPTYTGVFTASDGIVIFGPKDLPGSDCAVGDLAGSWVVDLEVKTPDGVQDAVTTDILLSGGTVTDIVLSEDTGALYFAGASYEVTDIFNNSDKIIVSPALDADKTFSVWLQAEKAVGEVQVELFQENADRTELYSIGISDFVTIPGGGSDPVKISLTSTWCTKLIGTQRVGLRVLDREGNTLAVRYPNVTVEKAVVERPISSACNIGIFNNIAGVKLPDDLPGIGGGKAGLLMPNFPFQVSVGLDGSAMIGINVNINAYTTGEGWKRETFRERKHFEDALAKNFTNMVDAYTKASGMAMDSSLKVGAANISFAKFTLYAMGLLSGYYSPEDGYVYVSGSILVQGNLNGSLATQMVIVVLPVYVGLDLTVGGGVQGSLAMRFVPSDFLDSFEFLKDKSSITLNLALELGFVAGIGVRNVAAVDAKGFIGGDIAIPTFYGKDLRHYKLYAGAKISATFMLFYYEKTLWHPETDYAQDTAAASPAEDPVTDETQWVDLTQTDAFRENIQTRETAEGVFTSSDPLTQTDRAPDYITELGQELYCGSSTTMSPGAQPRVYGETLTYLANVELADGSILTLPHRATIPGTGGDLGTPSPLLSPDKYAKYADGGRYVYDYSVQDVTGSSGAEDTFVLVAARGDEVGSGPDSTPTCVIASQKKGNGFKVLADADAPILDVGIAPAQEDAPYVLFSYYNPNIDSIVAGLWSKDSSCEPYYRPGVQNVLIQASPGAELVKSLPAGCYVRYVDKTAEERRAGEPLFWSYHIPYGYFVEARSDGSHALMCWDLSAWDGKGDYSKVTPRITEVAVFEDVQDLWSCARYQYTETYFRSGNAVYVTQCGDDGVQYREFIRPEGIDLSAYSLSYSLAEGQVRVMAMSVIDPTADGTIPAEDRPAGIEKSTTLYVWQQDTQHKLHGPRTIELPGYVYSAAQLTYTNGSNIRALLYNFGRERSTLDLLQETRRANVDMTDCISLDRYVCEGDPMHFRATFRNLGTTELTTATVGIYDADNPGSSTPLALVNVDLFCTKEEGYRNFLPGDVLTVDFSCICPSVWTSGTHSFYLRVIDETASPVDTLETGDKSVQLDVRHWAETTPKVDLWLRRARETIAQDQPVAETLRVSVSPDGGATWKLWQSLDLTREFTDTRTVPAEAKTLTLDLTETVDGVTPFTGSSANFERIRYEYIKEGETLLTGSFYLGGGLYGMPVGTDAVTLPGGSGSTTPSQSFPSDADIYDIVIPDGTGAQISVDGYLYDGSVLGADHKQTSCRMAALTFTTDYQPEEDDSVGTKDALALFYEDPAGLPIQVTVGGVEYTLCLRKGEGVTINVPAAYLTGLTNDTSTDLSALLGTRTKPADLSSLLTELEKKSVAINWKDAQRENYCVFGSADLDLDLHEFPAYYSLTVRNNSVTAADTRLAVYADGDSEPFFVVDKNDRAPALGKLNSDNTVTVRIDRSDLTAALGKAGKTDCDGLTFVAEAEEFTQGSMNRMFTDENAFDPADKTRYRVTSTSNPVVCRSYESVWVALHANDPALGTVSVGSSTGADASAEFSAMTKGVTVTATPTPGAHFVGWRNADGELVSVQATYELPALTGHTMLLADFAGNAGGNLGGTFADVDPAAWYYKAVGYVLKEGLMNGISAKHFSPDGTFTRAMLCQVFYNMAGRPAVTATGRFSDLEDGRWYCDAVAWATETGLVLGYGNGCFGPDDALTREQLAVVLYRYEQTCGGGLTGDPAEKVPDFKDAGQISPWAAEAMQWCVIKTILSGRGDGTLDPQGTATRAETAQVLMNYLGRT